MSLARKTVKVLGWTLVGALGVALPAMFFAFFMFAGFGGTTEDFRDVVAEFLAIGAAIGAVVGLLQLRESERPAPPRPSMPPAPGPTAPGQVHAPTSRVGLPGLILGLASGIRDEVKGDRSSRGE